MNSIDFWDCPSNVKWSHHVLVGKDTKKFNLSFIFPCKALQDFNKKEECNNIIKNQQMTFQASDLKGNHFLDLLDNELHTIKSLYTKGGLQINQFSCSNLSCARAIRAIMNHAPIGEYHLRFFLRKSFSCLCRIYLIKTRQYILHECRRYNKYWNSLRTMLSHLLAFPKFNLSVFSFHEDITQ